MSKTIQVQNGQINISSAQGQLVTVEGERKTAQDLANVLLQYYDGRYGSQLKEIVENRIPFATELLIRHFVSKAVDLLVQMQQQDQSITADELITQIDELLTTPNDTGTVGFYVRVLTQSGQTAETGILMETQLNHLTEGF